MRVRLGVLVAAAAIASAISAAAPAAPERDAVIRLGRAIGKVELGMTLPQVRRALRRRHVSVIRRIDFGARGRYLELGWELPGRSAWAPDAWSVGFRSTSRRGPLRVVRVSTGAPSQRTPQRVGVGVRPAAIVRAYPNATCVSRPFEPAYRHDWVVVEANGGMTAFNLKTIQTWQASGDPRVVVGVMVQRDWFSKGPGHRPCSAGWERW